MSPLEKDAGNSGDRYRIDIIVNQLLRLDPASVDDHVVRGMLAELGTRDMPPSGAISTIVEKLSATEGRDEVRTILEEHVQNDERTVQAVNGVIAALRALHIAKVNPQNINVALNRLKFTISFTMPDLRQLQTALREGVTDERLSGILFDHGPSLPNQNRAPVIAQQIGKAVKGAIGRRS